MDEQKLIQDPSQKVLAMYQAVIEFINEGCDINNFKSKLISQPGQALEKERHTNIFLQRKR